jgi:hypothetical protein
MKHYIIGIDPGKQGGICAIYGSRIADITEMPKTPTELYEYLQFLGLPNNYKGQLTIAIENVHAMPTDGSRQAFTFGRGLGQIEGVIAAMSLSEAVKRISPQEWMKYYKMKRNKDETKYSYKKRLRDLARQLSKRDLSLKICDAYLISKYMSKALY